jgi:hypothetical protein
MMVIATLALVSTWFVPGALASSDACPNLSGTYYSTDEADLADPKPNPAKLGRTSMILTIQQDRKNLKSFRITDDDPKDDFPPMSANWIADGIYRKVSEEIGVIEFLKRECAEGALIEQTITLSFDPERSSPREYTFVDRVVRRTELTPGGFRMPVEETNAQGNVVYRAGQQFKRVSKP